MFNSIWNTKILNNAFGAVDRTNIHKNKLHGVQGRFYFCVIFIFTKAGQIIK